MDAAFTRHGGRLAAAQAAFPRAPRPWIDLSTGVSPWPYPAPPATRAERARLPDPERTRALEAVAARAFGVGDPAGVVAVAGAETGLRLLPHLVRACAVAVPGPTYGGHADAWRTAGAEVLEQEADLAQASCAVVVNPNNPDGHTRRPAELLARADRLHARGGALVVDESFCDLSPELSMAGAGHPAVVVLRSFGKTYGLPGVRLGFVVAAPEIAARVRAATGDWPVAADALAAGLAAYGDPRWLERIRERLARAAVRLDRALVRAGFTLLGGATLFRLASAPDACARFTRLCEAGVLTRPFAEAPTWLRFGLPAPSAFSRVERALGALA